MKTSIGVRIRLCRKRLNLTQRELGKLVGVSHVAISQWEKEETEPKGDNLLALASALGCSPEYILKDAFVDNLDISIKPNRTEQGYPLISWNCAGNWSEVVKPYHRKSIDGWHKTTVSCSGDSFWLEVKGDSMTSPSGLSIPEGMMILVDPEITPTNRKLVVAKLGDENEVTFKQYIVDAGNHYLKPLNPQYRMVSINGNCKIIGVVVDVRIARLP
ncbi:LexA family transcriptional regulator [Xenorhabdus sp. SF857]|uniref:LexA family protein n=1 Tax=Xenorhabdus bakwenae TaxID=3026967 RepID=UPI002557E73A|nr:LexA family transcriptional regulator [Xenorhabdus sp. SF857]WFQ81308.1 LexA family transcriptional regulator [Xenorhabdus sp. SF857]